MRIAIASFSERGHTAARRLARALAADGDAADATRCGAGGPTLRDWTRRAFAEADGLIVVGAVAIAVRAVAPLLQDKTRDPAVVAVDESCRHAVAVLSGHIGGANRLTHRVAQALGAAPVVTTATDVTGTFAVDAWATEQGLAIATPKAIKRVSAHALAGAPVRLRSAFPVDGPLPAGWTMAEDETADVVIDVAPPADDETLTLIPPALTLGVGCRRGTAEAALAAAFRRLCTDNGLDPRAFARAGSIDLKADEPGLLAFCRAAGLEFTTHDAAALNAVPGDFTSSAFVRDVTGVDTVCERAAALGGTLRVGKTVLDGIAMAVGETAYRVRFGDSHE